MRRSWTIGLLSTLGLALAFTFSCSQKDDDDDDDDNRVIAATGGGGNVKPGDDDDAAGDDDDATGDDDDDATSNEPAPCENIEGLEDEVCAAETASSKPIKVNMMIVLDKSGSMEDKSVYAMAKWEALVGALGEALQSDNVEGNPNMSLGLVLFPGHDVAKTCNNEDCCMLSGGVDVEIGPASEKVGEILGALDSTGPAGLTPTSDALDAALAYFTSGAGALLKGEKYVLLATDGGPNCNESLGCGDEECTLALDGLCDTGKCCEGGSSPLWCVDHLATRDKIASLRDNNVKTIVVGIPGTEAYTSWLNGFADAGDAVAPSAETEGGAHYYEVAASGGVGALKKTFSDITVSLVNSCRIQLSETPPSTSVWLVNVALDCSAIPQGGGTTGAAGAGGEEDPVNWFVDESTDPPTIEVQGTYCDRIKKGVDRIDIIVGCPPRL